ncbi:MAG: hypothetical protein L0170_17965, partial [Acidobacteria bacterium]|nr:hypothetical protein [Acidobacteriota bacterium]
KARAGGGGGNSLGQSLGKAVGDALRGPGMGSQTVTDPNTGIEKARLSERYMRALGVDPNNLDKDKMRGIWGTPVTGPKPPEKEFSLGLTPEDSEFADQFEQFDPDKYEDNTSGFSLGDSFDDVFETGNQEFGLGDEVFETGNQEFDLFGDSDFGDIFGTDFAEDFSSQFDQFDPYAFGPPESGYDDFDTGSGFFDSENFA